VFQKDISGQYENNYELRAGVGVESWSRCGDHTAVLNVNSEIRINPASSNKKGQMTVSRILNPSSDCAELIICQQVDAFDGRLHVKFQAKWRSCGNNRISSVED
jgi:hypothetical protein